MNKVKDRVSEEEWNLREELSSAYHVFAMLGWTHLIHTHITVKGPIEGEFLINAFGLLWEEITPESLVKVDANGAVIDQGSTALGINPAGFKIHSAIHTSERADKWVMHIHVPDKLIAQVFTTFDDAGAGSVNFEEFLRGLFPRVHRMVRTSQTSRVLTSR